MDFLQRNSTLSVVNAMSICQWTITRKRILESRSERALLDFFIVNEKLSPFLTKMIVDEERDYSLGNYAQYHKNNRLIETDHNGLIFELRLEYSAQKPERREYFNFRNKVCQGEFKKETEINSQLLECFENELSVEMQCKKWLKTFNSIVYKCFRKIRVGTNKKKVFSNKNTLLRERMDKIKESKTKNITEDLKKQIEVRTQEIENEIGSKVVQEYHEEIIETINNLGGDETSIDGSGRQKLWKILKRKFPKTKSNIPMGKKDRKGNVISNHLGLKELYLKTYKHRLRNRPVQKEFEEIKDLKMILFNLRKKVCKNRKSEPWNMKNLDDAIKSLKKDKARDPNGWINELFKEGVAGNNLKVSMLRLFNKIKNENHLPDFMRKANMTTIYKGKVEESNLENERGIFIFMEEADEDKY